MIIRSRCVSLLAILLIPLTMRAETKKPDKDPGAKSGKTTQKQIVTSASAIAELLRSLGVAAAEAATLAKKLANENDPAHQEARKTAELLGTLAAELDALEVGKEIAGKVLTDTAHRRLTDVTPGGAARNLAGIGAIDAIAGPGSSGKLPQSAERNADGIARALADAVADLHTVGLSAGDPSFDAVIDKILKGGLLGSVARKVVRDTTDPLVKDAARDSNSDTKNDQPKSTPPPAGGATVRQREPKEPDFFPRTNPGGGGSSGSGATQPGSGTSSGQASESTQQPSAAGKKRGSAVINFEDPPKENSGEDSKTHQSEAEREAARKKEEEKKAAEDKAKKEKEDADKKKADEDKEEDTTPATSSGAEEAVGTSVDPDGEQAYHGKPTLSGILTRLQRISARLGHTTNPNPQSEGAIDRSIPVPDRKQSLIGNPGAPVTRKPPVIKKENVPTPGPKPGQVNPDPNSPSSPPARK